jgi:hypothetical protein
MRRQIVVELRESGSFFLSAFVGADMDMSHSMRLLCSAKGEDRRRSQFHRVPRKAPVSSHFYNLDFRESES